MKRLTWILVCVIGGYLLISAIQPDLSQNWRDNWRSLFRNAPRITVIITTPVPTAATKPTNTPTVHIAPTPSAVPSSTPTPATPYPTLPPLAQTPTPDPNNQSAISIPTPFPTSIFAHKTPTLARPEPSKPKLFPTPVTPYPTLPPLAITPTPPPTTPAGFTESELTEAREHALALINGARAATGLNPVTLDDNPAAQSHANDMRANCTFSHWGTDGLKPYMRYTLAGGEQYSAENVSGIDFCPSDPFRYIAKSISAEIDEAMVGLLNSPGHRRNILNPHHLKVGIGISYQRPNLWLVQLFTGDYVEFSEPPTFHGGILHFKGQFKNGVEVSADGLGVQIRYDQHPHKLTRGQLHHTYCYSSGIAIAALREPLPSNRFYTTDTFTLNGIRCNDPYEVAENAPVPTSYFEDKPRITLPYEDHGNWFTASKWSANNVSFEVAADVNDLLTRFGNGVYTIALWGEIEREEVLLSEYSIFVTSSPPTPTPTNNPTVTPTPIPTNTPTVTPIPTETSPPTVAPTPTVTPTPTPTAPSGLTASDLAAAREYALTLINQARTAAGLNEVTLDDNAAAQSHADDMRENCTFSHWGTDGLKPYMRYTLAGGQQYSAENVSGIDFCPSDPERYIANSITTEIDEAMDGLLNSPGHLRYILKPLHRKVNIGISYERPNLWLVQLFVGEYVEYSTKPKIEDGILTMSGRLKNGANTSGRSLGVQIYYDRVPHELTRGQLHQTTCGNNGDIIAALRRPPGPNAYYSTHSFQQSGTRCSDPYEVPVDAPVASSYFDHKIGVNFPYVWLNEAVWITATEWTVLDQGFTVSADISDLLDQYGNGVYTIVLWGEIDGDRTPISEYSIFIPPYSPAP